MNTETIGLNAGLIWNALNEGNTLSVKQLRKATKLKDKEVFAALGWLAREGKVAIDVDAKDEKEFSVSLVNA
jgi:hypothetical protein